MERRYWWVAQPDLPGRGRVPGWHAAEPFPKDTFVTIIQALGGNYTVTYNGQMVRVDGTDCGQPGPASRSLLSFPQPH